MKAPDTRFGGRTHDPEMDAAEFRAEQAEALSTSSAQASVTERRHQMTTTQLLGILVGIAIGAPLGIFLAHVLEWAWEAAADLAYDIYDKIQDRRK